MNTFEFNGVAYTLPQCSLVNPSQVDRELYKGSEEAIWARINEGPLTDEIFVVHNLGFTDLEDADGNVAMTFDIQSSASAPEMHAAVIEIATAFVADLLRASIDHANQVLGTNQ